MDERLKALIDAPLANPLRLNIPGGKENVPKKQSEAPYISPTDRRKIKERKAQQEQARLDQLYDYYAGTDVPPERVAEHMGVHKLVEDGTDDDGKVKYKRVLDVDTVRQQLASRRALRGGK